jgi:AcrR family transcriptional regulator
MPVQNASPAPQARERILETAYELFSRRGIRDVGVDEIIDRAGVAKATLYRHFSSKDELVLAFMELREERWTVGWVEKEALQRGNTPEERLFAIFEIFDEWFHQEDFAGCPFINTLLEMGRGVEVGRASVNHIGNLRSIVRRLAEEAGLRDPESFAHSWILLMKGSVVTACEGDVEAATRATAIAHPLIEQYRVAPPAERVA